MALASSRPPADSPGPAESLGRRPAFSLEAAAILFLVALVPRLAAALALSGEPVWDGHYYDFGAKRIAQGFGYSDDVMVAGRPEWHPWCHYPVGYSAFLSVFYRLFGSATKVAPVTGAVVGALLAVTTYGLARYALRRGDDAVSRGVFARLGDRLGGGRAFLAGLLVALHPGLVLYAALVMTEPLAALCTTVSFWLYAATRPDDGAPHGARSQGGLAAAALVLGLAALVRPQALLCAPFIVLHYARRRGLRDWLVGSLVTGALALAPVLPWTARNCRVMDGCALVSTNAGWNLAIGAFPRATGRFETLRSSDGCRVVTGQVQQDRCWFAYGIEQIKARPLAWLALVPKKLSFTFDHESFAVEYLREAKPWHWPEARRTAVRDALTAFHRLLVAAAAVAAVEFARRGRSLVRVAAAEGLVLALVAALLYDAVAGAPASGRFWPLVLVACGVPLLRAVGRQPVSAPIILSAGLVLTTAVTHAVFFGEDRYHVVVTPALCLLAASLFRAAPRQMRNAHRV